MREAKVIYQSIMNFDLISGSGVATKAGFLQVLSRIIQIKEPPIELVMKEIVIPIRSADATQADVHNDRNNKIGTFSPVRFARKPLLPGEEEKRLSSPSRDSAFLDYPRHEMNGKTHVKTMDYWQWHSKERGVLRYYIETDPTTNTERAVEHRDSWNVRVSDDMSTVRWKNPNDLMSTARTSNNFEKVFNCRPGSCDTAQILPGNQSRDSAAASNAQSAPPIIESSTTLGGVLKGVNESEKKMVEKGPKIQSKNKIINETSKKKDVFSRALEYVNSSDSRPKVAVLLRCSLNLNLTQLRREPGTT